MGSPPIPPLMIRNCQEAEIEPAANTISRERRPTLERLSLPGTNDAYHPSVGKSVDSTVLQDVEVQYLEDVEPNYLLTTPSVLRFNDDQAGPSNPMSNLGGSQQTERVHTLLRLGPSPKDPTVKQPKAKAKASKAKATRVAAKPKENTSPKRRVPRTAAITRGAKSPLQGTKLRKLNMIRSTNPPKKKLCVEQPAATVDDVDVVVASPICNEVADFQSPPNPLP